MRGSLDFALGGLDIPTFGLAILRSVPWHCDKHGKGGRGWDLVCVCFVAGLASNLFEK